jgi:hypothetical protein
MRSSPEHGGGRRSALAVGAAAVAGALGLGLFLFRDLIYGDVDGALALTLIRDARVWGSPWAQAQISPLQGMGALQLPVNAWINPGYAVLLTGASLPRVMASFLLFAGALFLAVFLLGRALRLGVRTAIVAAQIACLLPFPPFEEWAGLHPQLRLNPGTAYYVALALLCLGLFLRLGTGSRALDLARALLLPLLFLYSLLCDPLWTVVPFLSLAPFLAVALPAGRTPRTLAWRAGAVVSSLGLLLWLGVPRHLWGLFAYTARARFRTEIVGEIQDATYAFFPFRGLAAGMLFALLLAGILLALRHAEGAVRLFAAGALAHMALLSTITALYLYTDVNWTYPLPAYFQQAALPLFVLVALAGWVDGASRARGRFPRTAAALARHRLAAVTLVPAVAVLLVGAQASSSPRTPVPYDTDYLGRYAYAPFAALQEQVGAAPGRPFRGSAATYLCTSEPQQVYSAQARLWTMGVPTIEEYGQTISPPLYYLVSRGLGRPDAGPAARNHLAITMLRVDLLRALGVRFVVSTYLCDQRLRAAPHVLRLLPPESGIRIYELERPNLGTYSPVRVHRARTARETVALLIGPAFDPEQDVVLTEAPAGPLVPAVDATMRFERGGVRVRARSAGRSLLLLPLQYSHTLRVRAAGGEARLVRANLAQTGLVFTGEVEAFIRPESGIWRAPGREQDLADLDALEIGEDGTRAVPAAQRRRLHPHARFGLGRE